MIKYFDEMKERLKSHPQLESIKAFILSFEDENLKKYLSFLYLHMPFCDVANVGKEVILDFAKAGVNLIKSRCKDMDEEIFLNYVLFHRLGSEKIVPHRNFFFELIKDLLGDDERENVIKLNYWCSKNVTYRTTDTRTLDPITVYKSGFGRCGEESAFAVSVLRAAGIPARQIYVPLWAHCDDNHAWVEVFVEGDWHYLGACEGEEILDKGWFDDASARAMIVKNVLYGCPEGEKKDVIGFNEGQYEINQTGRYADTKRIRLYLSKGNDPLKNVHFNICLLNFGGFFPIIKAVSDGTGAYETEIGLGTIFLTLYRDKNFIIPLDTSQGNDFYVDIEEFEPKYNTYNEILITVPGASTRNRKKAPPKKDYGYKEKTFPNETAKDMAYKEGMGKLWDILCEKDKRDISIEILRDCYNTENLYNAKDDIYLNYIQNPRVGFENLNLCREIFSERFKNIDSILEFVKSLRLTGERLITEPLGVFHSQTGSALSIKIFVINALRSMGIASKLVNSEVFYLRDNEFIHFLKLSNILSTLDYIDNTKIYVEEAKEDEAMAGLMLTGDLSKFGESFFIAKFDSYSNALNPIDKSSVNKVINLIPGEYILSTANRLPGGNICCKYNILQLKAGSSHSVDIEYMQADLKDMLTKFILPLDLQKQLDISDNTDDISLLIWLKEEEEPSQHIANDLLLKEDLLKNINIKLLFTGDFKKKDYAINELLKKSVKKEIYTDLGDNLCEAFGRSMFVNHETLPIVALCKGNVAVYAFSGYQVGSGNMIEKIIELL